MIKYEKITKHRTDTTGQPCLYINGRRPVIGGDFGSSGHAIWSVQSAGISLHANGQKESGFHSHSGTVCSLYSKIGPKPYQTHQNNCVINGVIDQHGGENGAGRIFIKTKPWCKKRDKLNYPVVMTGLVSKSSPRFTVSLSLILNVITS